MKDVVYIITEISDNDLLFKIFYKDKQSDLYNMKGKAHRACYNPYLVYGEDVQNFIGKSKYDCTIVVAEVRSGSLK